MSITLKRAVIKRWFLLATVCPLFVACGSQNNEAGDLAAAPAPDETQQYLERSRALALRLGAELKGELQQALSNEGPAAAVAVCRDRAPAIAKRLSIESGAHVGRSSLRVRNPANAPQPWQRVVLQAFDDAGSLTPTASVREYHAAPTNGTDTFRYMRAIPAVGICLTCHGRDLSPEVEAALATVYPDDMATGYDAGQVRGAFVVSWPGRP